MQPNLQSLKRRPFLMPLLMPLVMLAVAVAAAIWLFDARTSTVIIAIRHAEVAQAQNSANSDLSTAGQARAQSLLTELSRAKPDRGVDAIYVVTGAASQQTAAPVAQSMGLAVNVVAAGDWASLPRRIARNHAGEVVLVVADAEALTSFLQHYVDASRYPVDAQDFGSLFVIANSGLSKPAVIRLRY
jgi:hypothetical protein